MRQQISQSTITNFTNTADITADHKYPICFRDLTGCYFPVLNAQIMAALPDVDRL